MEIEMGRKHRFREAAPPAGRQRMVVLRQPGPARHWALWCVPSCLCCSIVSVICFLGLSGLVAAIWEALTRPDTRAHSGSLGWDDTGVRIGGRHWCNVATPPPEWSLAGCELLDVVGFQFSVLSYNLVGHERETTAAGELLAGAHAREPLDLIGLQECQDLRAVLRHAGLDQEFSVLVGRREIIIRQHCMETLGCRALALAYRTSRWDVLDHGFSDVAEDKVTSLHGRRSVLWARFRDKTLGQTVFFMDYHGPLPVNSGGLCGGHATAFNLLKVAGHYAHRQDAVVLAGDFNADATSHTVTDLSRYFDAVHTDRPSTSLDHFFATCSRVVKVEDLSVNGSDQDALRVTLSVERARANISAV
eukprot:CAMPEP_0194488834 /NCGR_PEP_ID=MMETSP0253-20130528/8611_1 /TAXON_ID=2966 /ORGANISM="Noctiluca scintillans" /LENGTH=360 /DNA_ID=CAMNT_0039329241 /DNA_START=24 /DNA_END=1106 /DNA_ORIENTATION=+